MKTMLRRYFALYETAESPNMLTKMKAWRDTIPIPCVGVERVNPQKTEKLSHGKTDLRWT